MKYTIVLKRLKPSRFVLVLTLVIYSLVFGQAQEKKPYKSKQSFIEWNIGLANILDDGYFPGTSVLYGATFVNDKNIVFEYELGLAFPTIVTGKLGVGAKIDDVSFTIGVRPFPTNLYFQTCLPSWSNGNWVFSLEYNPLHIDHTLSAGAKAIYNIGYRWNLKSGK